MFFKYILASSLLITALMACSKTSGIHKKTNFPQTEQKNTANQFKERYTYQIIEEQQLAQNTEPDYLNLNQEINNTLPEVIYSSTLSPPEALFFAAEETPIKKVKKFYNLKKTIKKKHISKSYKKR